MRHAATAAVRGRALCLALALLASLAVPPTRAAQPQTRAGGRLADALEQLRSEGLDLVWSDRLVTPEMRVGDAVAASSAAAPEERLLALLRPHGLDARRAAGGRWVVVRATAPAAAEGRVVLRRSGAPVPGARVRVVDLGIETATDGDGRFRLVAERPGLWTVRVDAGGLPPRAVPLRFGARGPEARIELEPPVIPSEEIVVTPSHYGVSIAEPDATIGLDRAEREVAPVPGDDVLRAAATFPGTASSDVSARFHPRGGRDDEVLVLLDGLELYEPFHLRDLGSALSLVPPQAVASLELRLGGFSAAYGDKLSGLLDMTTVRPRSRPSGHIGASPIDLSATLGDATLDGSVSWFLSGRRGLLREASDLFGADERPAFSDVFGKAEWQPGSRHTLRLEGIEARDDNLIDKDLESSSSSYRTNHLWLAHDAVLGSSVVVETLAFYGRIDEVRDGSDTDPLHLYRAVDRRYVDVLGAQQRWNAALGANQSLKWGWASRELETIFDHRLDLDLSADPRAALRTGPPVRNDTVDRELHGRQGSVYGSWRWAGERLSTEAGLRFEESHAAEDEHTSPRVSLAWALGERSVLRASWGLYYQSLRSHELQVEDGESMLPEDEQARKAVLGLDHRFRSGLQTRAEVYERRTTSPRVRFVNLFDTLQPFPEASWDRIRLEPTRSRARGFEVSFQRRLARTSWRVSYTLSRTRDLVAGLGAPADDGVRSVPRAFDQTHAARLQWIRDRGPWSLALDAEVHTGWPTSTVAWVPGGADGKEAELVLLGLHDDRLPVYHRVDARLTRRFQSRWGEWLLYLDLLNVLNQDNVRGYELLPDPDSGQPPRRRELTWPGRVPNLGVRLRF